MGSLLEELARRQTEARWWIEELREQLSEVGAWLEAEEDRLSRLVTTQETVEIVGETSGAEAGEEVESAGGAVPGG